MKIQCVYGYGLEYSGYITAFVNEGGETTAVVVNSKTGSITVWSLNRIKVIQL